MTNTDRLLHHFYALRESISLAKRIRVDDSALLQAAATLASRENPAVLFQAGGGVKVEEPDVPKDPDTPWDSHRVKLIRKDLRLSLSLIHI